MSHSFEDHPQFISVHPSGLFVCLASSQSVLIYGYTVDGLMLVEHFPVVNVQSVSLRVSLETNEIQFPAARIQPSGTPFGNGVRESSSHSSTRSLRSMDIDRWSVAKCKHRPERDKGKTSTNHRLLLVSIDSLVNR